MDDPGAQQRHTSRVFYREVLAGLTAAVAVGAIVLLGIVVLTTRHSANAAVPGSGGSGGATTAQRAPPGVPHVRCGDVAASMIGTIVLVEGQRMPAGEGEGGGGGAPLGQSPPATPYSLTYVLITDGSGVCHLSGLAPTNQQNDGSDVAVMATVHQAPSGLVYEAVPP